MPFTPFHVGPGAALHALAPRRLSFLAFCAANVLIDVEPLYYMLTHQHPLHRFFHTFAGALLVASATVGLFMLLRRAAPRDWTLPTLSAVVVGALAGTLSHVLLDSIMHTDMAPFAPFSDLNPLLRIVSLDTLHLACVAAGLAGGAWVLLRAVLAERADTRRPGA